MADGMEVGGGGLRKRAVGGSQQSRPARGDGCVTYRVRASETGSRVREARILTKSVDARLRRCLELRKRLGAGERGARGKGWVI